MLWWTTTNIGRWAVVSSGYSRFLHQGNWPFIIIITVSIWPWRFLRRWAPINQTYHCCLLSQGSLHETKMRQPMATPWDINKLFDKSISTHRICEEGKYLYTQFELRAFNVTFMKVLGISELNWQPMSMSPGLSGGFRFLGNNFGGGGVANFFGGRHASRKPWSQGWNRKRWTWSQSHMITELSSNWSEK